MKRFLFVGAAALAGVLGLAPAPATAQAQAKIGYVNVQQIMAQAPGLAEARQAFETEVQQAQPELQRMEAELETLQQAFQQQQATLSEEARQQRQQELQTKFTAYQTRRTALQQREQQLLAPITARVEQVIEQIRKDGSYSVIFDTAQSGIVSADPALDLTNRVLDRLKTAGK